MLIEPVPGTTLAEDKDAAREIREKRIIPALDQGDLVEIDFEKVETATQSFVHALISEPLRRFGESVMERVTFVNCSQDVREIVITVVEYTLMAADATKAENQGNATGDAGLVNGTKSAPDAVPGT